MDDNIQGDQKAKKGFWTWERSIEVTKIVATLYAACLGTFVTMQFNERQHELARIEAIAKMLPSLAAREAEDREKSPDSSASADNSSKVSQSNADQIRKATEMKQRMVRDGAIWAIFRTAQNKNMLRDLANLFPDDIYRVVSSIAASGGLEHDDDEITALQIASEKLANKYMDAHEDALATKLYNQALRLKERLRGQPESLYIVDLNDKDIEELPAAAMADRESSLLKSLNKLGELHSADSEESHRVNTGHYQSKQLFNRVRNLGKNATDVNCRNEVARADLGLAHLFEKEKRFKTAIIYLEEAQKIAKETGGEASKSFLAISAELTRVKQLAASHAESHSDSRLENKMDGKVENRLEGKLDGKLENKLDGKLEAADSQKKR